MKLATMLLDSTLQAFKGGDIVNSHDSYNILGPQEWQSAAKTLRTLGNWTFTGSRVSSPIDAWQGHPLLHMWLETWIIPCVHFGWWFSPWELWAGDWIWLVDIVVLPMGLQTPSALSVLSLTSPLGILCSVQWLAACICLCTSQALAEPLRRQLYQAQHFLASTIVFGFGDCIWDGSPSGAVSGF